MKDISIISKRFLSLILKFKFNQKILKIFEVNPIILEPTWVSRVVGVFNSMFSIERILKISLIFLLSFSQQGCHEKSLKRTYEVDSCLQETLRMLASNHPKRKMVYKIKEYKGNNYVLYLRWNKQWWYYRTIDEDDLIDRDMDTIQCPDFNNSIFKGDK